MGNTEKNEQEHDSPKSKPARPLIFILMTRTVFFMFLFLCALLVLFLIGNFQQFTDGNQILILISCSFTSMLLIIFSACTFVTAIICALLSKTKISTYVATIIITIFSTTFAAATIAICNSILIIAK